MMLFKMITIWLEEESLAMLLYFGAVLQLQSTQRYGKHKKHIPYLSTHLFLTCSVPQDPRQ